MQGSIDSQTASTAAQPGEARDRGPTPPVASNDSAAPAASAAQVQQQHRQRQRHATLDSGAIKAKLVLLVFLAALGGAAASEFQGVIDQPVWPLLAGLMAVAFVVNALGQWWITRPLHSLLHQAEVLARSGTGRMLKRLPTTRPDEVGRLARVMYTLGLAAVRHEMQARQLRRTLDQRVEQATRRATRKLENLAYRDPLTDLGNRRLLDEHMDELVNLARASQTDLLCMIIDIDDFKDVNDDHGHAAGDEVLVMLSSLIRASTRKGDMAARIGGDEFAIFMPGAPIQRAWQFTQSLRTMFRRECQVRLGDGKMPNLSIGVADLNRDGVDDGNQLLEAADANLYAAKRAGKGRTVGLVEAHAA